MHGEARPHETLENPCFRRSPANRGVVLFVKNDTRYDRALLAEVYGKGGQVAEGLRALAEELAQVDTTGKPIAHVYTSVSRWMKEKKVRRVQDGYQKV